MRQRHDVLWSVSGHGGSGPRKPDDPPPEDPEIVAKRLECQRIEAELYARRQELRELAARAGRKK